MTKFVVLGLVLVLAAEVLAFMFADHHVVLWVSGGTAALVLLGGCRLLSNASTAEQSESLADGPAEQLQKWIARTETLIRWADSSQADWDRHLRPRLAREFMTATGQRHTKEPAALQATGRMVFGDELWQWVDPSNVAPATSRKPGPGREALYEILQRLERV